MYLSRIPTMYTRLVPYFRSSYFGIFLLSCLLSFSSVHAGENHSLNGQSIISFIANQNQWEDNIKFKAPLPGGDLFLEQQNLTFLFWDEADIRNAIHKHSRNVEDTIIHEQIHIKEDEPKLRRGHSVSVDYDSNEERVERLTREKLLKKYGSQIYEVDQNAAIFAFKMQQELKTIFFGTLEYWIHRYFTDHFDEYENYAIPMYEKLEKDGYLNDIKFVSDNATRVYQNEFNFVLTNLI